MKKNKIRKNIIILGSNGMLGTQVFNYFKNKHNIVKINKKFNIKNIFQLINYINSYKSSIVINCIGIIKQKKNSYTNIIFSNSILPLFLSKFLKKKHTIIHPSTDCVYNGKQNSIYKKQEKPNANDVYGVSKILAENYLINRKNTLIIRTSIIGISKTGKDFMTWAIKNKNKKIFGYINHYWNGITTLEWCKNIEPFIKKNTFKSNSTLIQLGTSECVSKFKLLKILKEKFNLKYNIVKKKTEYINRCLKSDIYIKNINDQIDDLKKYWNI